MKYSWMILICLLFCGCDEIKQRIADREKHTITRSFYLTTIVHDEHLFIMSNHYFIHHPDCPCSKKQTSEKIERSPIIIEFGK